METQSTNGVYKGGKRNRRIRALKRLENSLALDQEELSKWSKATPTNEFDEKWVKENKIPTLKKDISRKGKEISILKSKI